MDRRRFSASVIGAAVASATYTKADSHANQHKVAIIGHTGRGDYGHGLDTVWKRLPNTQVTAVADANASGLKKAVAKLGLPAAAGFADYREMLTSVRPSIVAVCPRHADQHRDMIVAAIKAGAKGVYVEKPFARTPRECDEVLAACAQYGAVVAVAHRNRYHPVMKVVTDLVREGRIGRLLEIRGRGKGDRRGGAEDLWVLGSHVLNMICYLGGKPNSCAATLLQDGRPVTKADVRDGAEGLGPLAGNELHARYLLEGGVTAFFDSVANDGTQNHGFGLQLIGSEGVIAMRADRDPLAHLILGNPFQVATKPRTWLPITSGGVDVTEPDPKLIDRVHHHDVAAADLIAAMKEGRQPLCSAEEGALTVEMICSVFESHRQGSKAVSIPLKERDHPLLKL